LNFLEFQKRRAAPAAEGLERVASTRRFESTAVQVFSQYLKAGRLSVVRAFPHFLHRSFDLFVGLVLAQGVHRPDRSWYPANQGDLKQQAKDASERATDREKSKPGQEQGKDESHICRFGRWLVQGTWPVDHQASRPRKSLILKDSMSLLSATLKRQEQV
jgi:hypothetical protein